jgi:hypothetical protein
LQGRDAGGFCGQGEADGIGDHRATVPTAAAVTGRDRAEDRYRLGACEKA